MASWSEQKGVGSFGSLMRVTVSDVSVAGNSTTVDVKIELYNGGNSTSFTGSVPWSISGAVSKPSANTSFSIASKTWGTLGTYRAAIAHNADGTKTATVTGYVGATGTSTFGTPGSLSVTFTLPRIPKAPAKMAAPTFSSITASSARATGVAPDNMGSAITGYEFQREGAGAVASPDLVEDFTGLTRATAYKGRVRAKNAVGWGVWSDYRAFTTLALAPSKPVTPTISAITSSSARAAIASAPNNGGSAITRFEWLVEGGSWVNGTTALNYLFTGLTANKAYRAKTRARNAIGAGPESDWSNTFTTAPLAPNAATGGSTTRVSDTAQDLKWTNNPTTERPYSSIEIERYSTSNPTRVKLPPLAGTATSYRDSGTVASQRYDYFVRPVNAGGPGSWLTLGGVNTTPAAPINLAAVKEDTSIKVTWEAGTAQWGIINYLIEDNPGGTGWVPVGSVGNVLTWTHAAPNNSVTHQYRVKTVVRLYSDASPTLTSAASAASAVVQLLAPPLMPTLKAPVGTQDQALPIKFVWEHNPVDTTTQRAYAVRYRVGGGAWVNLAGTTAQTVTIPALNVAGTVEWQAQTRGQHPDFGPWSAIQAFVVAAAPTVAVNSPTSGQFLQSRVTATWGYYQPASSQASWVVQLLDDFGQVMETRQGTGTASTATLQTALKDSTAYSVKVSVTAANGLKATDQVGITTAFPLPVTVPIYPVFDPVTGGTTFTFGELPIPGPGESIPDYLDVTRQIGDGPETLIGTGYSPGDAGNDPLPDLVQINRYRAVSRTTLPTEAIGEPAELVVGGCDFPGPQFYVNGGTGFGTSCTSRGSTTENTPEVEVAHHQFVGDTYPTAFFGAHATQTVAFGGRLIEESSNSREWTDLLHQRGTVCLRDWLGRRVFGTLTVGFPHADGMTILNGQVFRTEFNEEEFWLAQNKES